MDFAGVRTALEEALRFHGEGQLEDAEYGYRQVLAAVPEHADSLHLLGMIAYQRGRHGDAVRLISQAVAIDATSALFHVNLGNALYDSGRAEHAVEAFRRALLVDPAGCDAYCNLGNVLTVLGRLDPAVASLNRSLVLRKNFPEAYYNLGNVLKEMGVIGRAADAYRGALCLNPGYPLAWNNLGVVTKRQQLVSDAVVQHCRAIRLDHQHAFPQAENNLGSALRELGRFEEAVASHRRATVLDPGRALYQEYAAYALFCLGRMREAWAAYEFRSFVRPAPPLPRWDGVAAPGRTLLIWNEQGIADQLLAVNLVQEATGAMGAVVLECDHRLVALMARSFPDITVIPDLDPPHPLREVGDCQIPLFSLGQYFRRTMNDFPRHQGYLRADPARVAHWKSWLASLGAGLKIGFSWRSINPDELEFFLPSLERLQPLLSLPGLTFVNLQYGRAEAELEALFQRTGHRIHIADGLDVTNDIDDLAALISALDAVAGPSSTSSILAGALGRPTLMYMVYPLYNENRFFNLDYVPWLPSAKIIRYGSEQDLDRLVELFSDNLTRLVVSL